MPTVHKGPVGRNGNPRDVRYANGGRDGEPRGNVHPREFDIPRDIRAAFVEAYLNAQAQGHDRIQIEIRRPIGQRHFDARRDEERRYREERIRIDAGRPGSGEAQFIHEFVERNRGRATTETLVETARRNYHNPGRPPADESLLYGRWGDSGRRNFDEALRDGTATMQVDRNAATGELRVRNREGREVRIDPASDPLLDRVRWEGNYTRCYIGNEDD